MRFTDEQIVEFSQRTRDDLHRSSESGSRLIADQKRRLADLERQQQKLLAAYMADALPVDALGERQSRVGGEIADAKRLIQNAQTASGEVYARLEEVLALLRHAERLYASVGDDAKGLLSSAVFEGFWLENRPEDGHGGRVVADAPLTPSRAPSPPTGATNGPQCAPDTTGANTKEPSAS